MSRNDPLNLVALDGDDLQVISACLQDGITRLVDMTYLPRQRTFAAVFSRFRWEKSARAEQGDERVRSGVHFNDVTRVQVNNIDQADRNGLLPLLAVTAEEGEAGALITLAFAGNGTIRLSAGCIDAQLMDMGHPWLAQSRPSHPNED